MESRPIVIGIISSARDNSNSAVLVREALKGAAGKGAAAREINLPKYDLEYCTGCLSCMKNGKCRLPDGLTSFGNSSMRRTGSYGGRRLMPGR